MVYKNRHGDNIAFTFQEETNTILMSGFFHMGLRCGYDNDNPERISMVDPSGGPYIEAGHDMKDFGFPGKVIDHFTIGNGVVTIHLK